MTEEQQKHEQKRQNSLVSVVTADYAMQNVILQLGLKLFTPDGMRVKEVRRWVLRCHACETVTANTQRVFCPKCGNNALERVEKFTGSDGAEHYGVRNKHVLKGTKYSIPMPKSGRTGKKMEPILREDQLIGRKITKKERELNNISKKTEDVFNCEFSEDKYGEYKHVGDAQKTIISIGGGTSRRIQTKGNTSPRIEDASSSFSSSNTSIILIEYYECSFAEKKMSLVSALFSRKQSLFSHKGGFIPSIFSLSLIITITKNTRENNA